MNRTRIVEPTRLAWQTGIKAFDQANFLISWEYGAAQELAGDQVIRRLVYLAGQQLPTVAIQAVVRSARRGRFLEVYGNPLVGDERLWPVVVKLLKKLAAGSACSFVRLQPPLLKQAPYLADLGLRKAKLDLGIAETSLLDLSASLDKLKSGLRRQTRYRIKQAAKQGIEIETKAGQSELERLLELVEATAQQRHFTPHASARIRNLYQALGPAQAKLYQAYTAEGELLSLALIIVSNQEADYFLGANTPAGHRHPGAGALQWQAIRDAKAAGCRAYNFWGIAPEGQANHPLMGVSVFKLGFGGQRLAYQGAYDLVLRPVAYWLSYLVELGHCLKRFWRRSRSV